MPEALRVNRVCPIKRSAPAQCNDCAIAVRVLDEAGMEDLRKRGVKEVEAQAYDCPFRMPVLYLGEIVKLLESIADQTSAIADALEDGATVKGGSKRASKKETKKATKPLAGDDLEG